MRYTQVSSSSSIMFIGYEPETRTLGIIFKSGGLSEYHYSDVPPEVFETLQNAESVGRSVDQYVKKAGFKYQRIR
jgi:hypothetical protein